MMTMMTLPPQLCLVYSCFQLDTVTSQCMVLTLHSNKGQVQKRDIKSFYKKKEERAIQRRLNFPIIPRACDGYEMTHSQRGALHRFGSISCHIQQARRSFYLNVHT